MCQAAQPLAAIADSRYALGADGVGAAPLRARAPATLHVPPPITRTLPLSGGHVVVEDVVRFALIETLGARRASRRLPITNRLATRTTHVSMLACLAGAGAGRLTSSRVPWRRATPCRRRRRSTVAVHTAIVVANVAVATARRLVARPPHTSTTATLHTAAPVVTAAATRALKARPPPRLRVAP